MLSAYLASPGVGTVESRRLHQMYLVKLEVKCKRDPQPNDVLRNLEGSNAFFGSLVVGHLG